MKVYHIEYDAKDGMISHYMTEVIDDYRRVRANIKQAGWKIVNIWIDNTLSYTARR